MMLDVHPPHEATHTWKDFFIHIATIVVGLVIAVGLEQAVEAIHHRHVRDELRVALRNDGEDNQDWVAQDFEWLRLEQHWALKQALKLEHSTVTTPLLLEREPPGHLNVPNTGAWLTAKANGDVHLLSAPEQEWFTDMDRVEADSFVSNLSAAGQIAAAKTRLDKDLLGLPAGTETSIDVTQLTAQQRAELADAFRTIAAAVHYLQAKLIIYNTYVHFLLSLPGEALLKESDKDAYTRFLEIEHKTMMQYPDSVPSYANRKGE